LAQISAENQVPPVHYAISPPVDHWEIELYARGTGLLASSATAGDPKSDSSGDFRRMNECSLYIRPGTTLA